VRLASGRSALRPASVAKAEGKGAHANRSPGGGAGWILISCHPNWNPSVPVGRLFPHLREDVSQHRVRLAGRGCSFPDGESRGHLLVRHLEAGGALFQQRLRLLDLGRSSARSGGIHNPLQDLVPTARALAPAVNGTLLMRSVTATKATTIRPTTALMTKASSSKICSSCSLRLTRANRRCRPLSPLRPDVITNYCANCEPCQL
jgi:hypothetical protein